MTFAGPALQDVGTIQEAFPRQFTLQEVADKLGWISPRLDRQLSWGYLRIISARCLRILRRGWLSTRTRHGGSNGSLTTGDSDEWRKLAG